MLCSATSEIPVSEPLEGDRQPGTCQLRPHVRSTQSKRKAARLQFVHETLMRHPGWLMVPVKVQFEYMVAKGYDKGIKTYADDLKFLRETAGTDNRYGTGTPGLYEASTMLRSELRRRLELEGEDRDDASTDRLMLALLDRVWPKTGLSEEVQETVRAALDEELQGWAVSAVESAASGGNDIEEGSAA